MPDCLNKKIQPIADFSPEDPNPFLDWWVNLCFDQAVERIKTKVCKLTPETTDKTNVRHYTAKGQQFKTG